MRRRFFPLVAAVLVALACSGEAPEEAVEGTDPATGGEASGEMAAPPAIGPADGRDLPPADLERVAIGDIAPDFTLPSYRGDALTLSDARGDRDILLVFYRGHW